MKKITYLITIIVFFNFSLVFLYHFGITNNYGLQIYNNFFDIIVTNLIVIFVISAYMFVYKKYMIREFNYFKIAIIGILVGFLISIFIPSLSFHDKLFIVLFTSFSFTYVSYSIYFDQVKKDVFK